MNKECFETYQQDDYDYYQQISDSDSQTNTKYSVSPFLIVGNAHLLRLSQFYFGDDE